MTHSVLRRMTLILSGVVIGVTISAVLTGDLPWWLGIGTTAVCVICALMPR